MGTRTSYAEGTPSWVDLQTPDTEAAKAFYGPLLGWTFDEQPTDNDGGFYVMCFKDGAPVAGMMRLTDEMAASGMPPAWSSYVTVDDIAASVAKVEPAGGAVLQPPFDVMDAGRMAVIADPTGAVICLWQANQHIGAGLVNEPGSLCWNELLSTDIDASTAFYAAVLGWGADVTAMEGGPVYTSFTVDGNGIAGGMASPMEGMPSVWGIYFAVADCDASAAAATAAGATLLYEPMSVPGVGRMVGLIDPTGGMVNLITMDEPSP